MADWVKVDPKSGARLKLRLRRAEAQCERFAVVEIVDEKVEMQTLGLFALGPRRRSDGCNFLEPDGRVAVVEQFDPGHFLGRKVAEGPDLESAKLGVKLCELEWFGTVDGGDGESNSAHAAR